MTIDQISVFVENEPGKLADVTKVLADADVDLRAMSIADTRDFGILRVIVNDAYGATNALKTAGYVVSLTKVLAVEIEDKPGGLADVLACLAKEAVSVEYLYAFVSRKAGNACVILRVEDTDRAVKVLVDAGVHTARADELFEE
jgi:hypothetical protein